MCLILNHYFYLLSKKLRLEISNSVFERIMIHSRFSGGYGAFKNDKLKNQLYDSILDRSSPLLIIITYIFQNL